MVSLSALLAAPSYANATSPDGGSVGSNSGREVRDVTRIIDKVAPKIEGTTRSRLIDIGDGVLKSAGSSVETKVTEAGLVEVGRVKDPGKALRVKLPRGLGSPKPVLADDGTALYLGNKDRADIAVQAFDHGTRIQTVIDSSNSPTEYAYEFSLPAGSKITAGKGGGAVIFDANGTFLGGLAAPWAKDRTGKNIPTRYSIRGNRVVQIVDHRQAGAQYPVTADPWLWKDLISSASWAYDSPNRSWTLKVSPTGWARSLGGGLSSYSVGSAGWNELYSKYKSRGLTVDLGAMRDQFICHEQFAWLKSTWNLDEWRPDVSFSATVGAFCNP
jgi:Protein of unknown function (DUF2599)